MAEMSIAMTDVFLGSLDSPALAQAYRRTVIRPPPPDFNVEVLPPAKQGANYHYGMRINPRVVFNPTSPISETSSMSSKRSREYVVWRRWEDCLEFQRTLEIEYLEISKRRRKGKPMRNYNDERQIYPAHRAASFESLPTGSEPSNIPLSVHAHLPKLSKKSTLFRASNTIVFQRGEEFKALIQALFDDNMPSAILEMRSLQTVRDFFAYWRRDKDSSGKSGMIKSSLIENTQSDKNLRGSADIPSPTLALVPSEPSTRINGVSSAFPWMNLTQQSRPASPRLPPHPMPSPSRPLHRPPPLLVDSISQSPMAPYASSSLPQLMPASRSGSRRPSRSPSGRTINPSQHLALTLSRRPSDERLSTATERRTDAGLLRPARKISARPSGSPELLAPFPTPPQALRRRSEASIPPPPLSIPTTPLPPPPLTAQDIYFHPQTYGSPSLSSALSPNHMHPRIVLRDSRGDHPSASSLAGDRSFGQSQQRLISTSTIPPPSTRPSTATSSQPSKVAPPSRPSTATTSNRPATSTEISSQGPEVVIKDNLHSPRTRGAVSTIRNRNARIYEPDALQTTPIPDPATVPHDIREMDFPTIYEESTPFPSTSSVSVNVIGSSQGRLSGVSIISAYSIDSAVRGEDEWSQGSSTPMPSSTATLNGDSRSTETLASLDTRSSIPPPRPPRSALRASMLVPALSPRSSSGNRTIDSHVDAPPTPRDEHDTLTPVRVRHTSEDFLDSYFQTSPMEQTFSAMVLDNNISTSMNSQEQPLRGRAHTSIQSPKMVHSRATGQIFSTWTPAAEQSAYSEPSSPLALQDTILIKVTYVPTDCIIVFRAPRIMSLEGIRQRLANKFYDTERVTLKMTPGPQSFTLQWVPPRNPVPEEHSSGRGRSDSVASIASIDASRMTLISSEVDWVTAVQECGGKLHLRIP